MNKNFFTSAYASVPGAILTAVFGLILLIWPTLSSTILCYALSAGVLVYGVYRLIAYFRHKPQSAMQRHDFSSGIILVVLALIILIKPELVISVLPVLLGLLLVMGAARETQIAIDLSRMEQARWYLPLIAAVVQAILGVMILWNPFATAMVLMQFIGISLLVESVSQIVFTAVVSRLE